MGVAWTSSSSPPDIYQQRIQLGNNASGLFTSANTPLAASPVEGLIANPQQGHFLDFLWSAAYIAVWQDPSSANVGLRWFLNLYPTAAVGATMQLAMATPGLG